MTKKAAVINDLSGFGKCSLTAAIAVLSAMGVQPCPVPTAVLTNQSGYKHYKSVDFTDNMSAYTEMWRINNASFDGIYSGYITNKKQVDMIINFIDTFRGESTAVIVDPVMADNGVVYREYSDAMCRKMRDLVRKADYITPNLTELCMLTDNSYEEISSLSGDRLFARVEAASLEMAGENNQTVVVTGVASNGKIHNCVFGGNDSFIVQSKLFDGSYSGTGDLFASAFCGGILGGLSVREAVEKASKFLEISIADTVCLENIDRNDGVEFERNLKYLIPPAPACAGRAPGGTALDSSL